jgi:hypothetical protein
LGFSLLVWECQYGDQALKVIDIDNPVAGATILKPNVITAIAALKTGIGLSAINAILFTTTLFLSSE